MSTIRSLQPICPCSPTTASLLAVYDVAILWAYPGVITKDDSNFSPNALRLLDLPPANPFGIPLPPCTVARCFVTPIAAMKSPSVPSNWPGPLPPFCYTSCVLPHSGSILEAPAATFASPTDIFIFIAIARSQAYTINIIHFTSTSSLYDTDVSYAICHSYQPLNEFPQQMSVTTLTNSGLNGDTELFCLLTFEWCNGGGRRRARRLRIAKSDRSVLSSDNIINRPPGRHDAFEMFREIAEALGRRVFSYFGEVYRKDEAEWNWQQDSIGSYCIYQPWKTWANRPLEPIQIYDHAVEEAVKMNESKGRNESVYSFVVMQANGKVGDVIFAICDESNQENYDVISSQHGRVIVLVKNTLYSGFIGRGLPSLEKVARAACFKLLNNWKKIDFTERVEFDFNSTYQFFSSTY